MPLKFYIKVLCSKPMFQIFICKQGTGRLEWCFKDNMHGMSHVWFHPTDVVGVYA